MKVKNWKTTLVGFILASLYAIQPIFQYGEVTLSNVLIAVAIAVFGLISKDFDKTGI
jgi:hypothetical protein